LRLIISKHSDFQPKFQSWKRFRKFDRKESRLCLICCSWTCDIPFSTNDLFLYQITTIVACMFNFCNLHATKLCSLQNTYPVDTHLSEVVCLKLLERNQQWVWLFLHVLGCRHLCHMEGGLPAWSDRLAGTQNLCMGHWYLNTMVWNLEQKCAEKWEVREMRSCCKFPLYLQSFTTVCN